MRDIHPQPKAVQPEDALVVTLRLGDLRRLIRSELEQLDSSTPPEVLDRRGAAALLRVSVAQLDRLAKSGKIRQHTLGDSPRYLRAELLEDVRSPPWGSVRRDGLRRRAHVTRPGEARTDG